MAQLHTTVRSPGPIQLGPAQPHLDICIHSSGLNHALVKAIALGSIMPGWRQAIAQDREASRSPRNAGPGILDVQQSHAAVSHLKDWCFGRLSGPELKEHALAHVADNGKHGANKIMAELSQIDWRAGNRGLLNKMKSMAFTKLIEAVPRSLVTNIVLPHKLIGELTQHPTIFRRHLGADPQALLSFWTGLYNSIEGQRLFSEHKQLQGRTPQDLIHTLPLVVHEDAGPYGKTQSVVEVSWSSLLGKGTDLQCKYVSFTYLKETKAELEAKLPNRAWHDFIDSLVLLRQGFHGPESALSGMPVAQGPDGIVWEAVTLFGKADGEQMVAWGMSSYNGTDEMCGYCLANRSDRPYTDLRDSAAWQPSEIGSTSPFFLRLRQPHHPLVVAEFFTFWFFRIDIMHLWDCKGVWSIVLGSVLWLLVHQENRLGTNQAARLEAINEKKNLFYAARGVQNRLPKLRLSNLVNGQTHMADLSGQIIKAANTRALLPFAAELAAEFFDSGSVYHKSMQKLCKAAADIVELLYTADTFLSVDEKAKLKALIHRLGKYFMLCQSISASRGEPCWHVTPKTHSTCHIPKQAALINPVKVQNYMEESLVGKVAQVWHGCASGTYQSTVQHTALFKYVLGLFLDLGVPLHKH
jgi:hypothetical protein